MSESSWLHCYVLNRKAYRETSLMVDCFSREAGKIRFIAKGVRNSKSDKKSLLQPFQRLSIQIKGRSELKNLSAVESDAPALNLKGNALFCGMYVNELLNRIMPSELASEALYDIYQETLITLCDEVDIEICLRQFEFALLEEMGVMPPLSQDARTGDEVIPAAAYQYIEGEGMVFSSGVANEKDISGEALISLEQGIWNPQTRYVAKRLCRQILAPLIGDKPLKSRALFAPKSHR